jgi:hypothetical protein
MNPLSRQRCYQHQDREAVVRCPACQHYFCRECVTEHDDRMLCSRCLARITGASAARSSQWFKRVAACMQGIMGFLILWYLFYLVGLALLAIPHTFHEGTIWQADWWRQP